MHTHMHTLNAYLICVDNLEYVFLIPSTVYGMSSIVIEVRTLEENGHYFYKHVGICCYSQIACCSERIFGC